MAGTNGPTSAAGTNDTKNADATPEAARPPGAGAKPAGGVETPEPGDGAPPPEGDAKR